MFEIKSSVGLVSLKRYLLGLQISPFLLYPHMSFFLCTCFSGISVFKSPQSYAIRVSPMASFYLFIFNWSIVDLQYCISLRCTAKWFSYVCLCVCACVCVCVCMIMCLYLTWLRWQSLGLSVLLPKALFNCFMAI